MPLQSKAFELGLQLESSRFLAPVFVGDTLYSRLTLTEQVPGRTTGVLAMRSEVQNQNDICVMEGAQRYLLRKRMPARVGSGG